MFIMHKHGFLMRAHRFTGNEDTGITGMQSGAASGRWRWIVDPVYAASEPGLGNSGYKPNEHKDTDKDINFQSKM